MRLKKIHKLYIYEREERKCIYCGKELFFRQASLDHYLPRSRGGPDELFNLVLSCNKCNQLKQNVIPEDYESRMIYLFKRGVMDEKILSAVPRLKKKELKELIQSVDKLEEIHHDVVFQSATNRLYVRNNKIIKRVQIHVWSE